MDWLSAGEVNHLVGGYHDLFDVPKLCCKDFVSGSIYAGVK